MQNMTLELEASPHPVLKNGCLGMLNGSRNATIYLQGELPFLDASWSCSSPLQSLEIGGGKRRGKGWFIAIKSLWVDVGLCGHG